MRKKLISTVTAVALLFCCFAMTAFAAETDTANLTLAGEATIFIQQGESLLFENKTATYGWIKWPSRVMQETYQVIDYVAYKSNATISGWSYNVANHTVGGSFYVNTYGTAVITGISEEPAEIRYDPTVFEVSIAEHPAVYRLELEAGESSTLTNKTNQKEYIMVRWGKNVGEMDVIIRRADGTVSSSYTTDLSEPLWGANIAPGYTVTFSIIRCEEPVNIYGPYSIYAPTK